MGWALTHLAMEPKLKTSLKLNHLVGPSINDIASYSDSYPTTPFYYLLRIMIFKMFDSLPPLKNGDVIYVWTLIHI